MTFHHQRIIRIFAWLGLLSGIFLFVFSFFPYTWLKSAGDHFAKDGNLESFTYVRYLIEFVFIRWIGVILGGIGLLFWFKDIWVFHGIVWVSGFARYTWKLLKLDTKVVWNDLRQIKLGRWEWWGLIGFTVVGLALRTAYLYHPVEYDEGYTYSEFARYPLLQFIGDFSVPNNHIFHSILVHFSTLLFGDSLPAIRLPVFIAGLLLIPLIYLLGRALFNRTVGLMAAGVISFYPVLAYKSTSARGYALIASMILCLFLLGIYVHRKNNFAAWLLIVLVGSAGFFTNLSMVYPVSAYFLWLFMLSWDKQTRLVYSNSWNWLRQVFFCGLGMALVSVILYIPIIVNRGLWVLLTASGVAEPLSLKEFIGNFPDYGQSLIGDWSGAYFPIGFFIFLAFGVALSIIMPSTEGRERISILPALIFAPGVLFFIQRAQFFARIWLWLLPLLLLCSVAGWSYVVLRIGSTVHQPKIVAFITAACLLIITCWYSAQSAYANIQALINPSPQLSANVEDRTPAIVTLLLKNYVTPNDVVVVDNCADAQYWYDFIYYQIPEIIIRRAKNRPFNHAYVIVYPYCHDQTLEKVVDEVGPDRVFLNLQQARLIAGAGNTLVYEVDSNPELIKRVYNVPLY